MPDLRIVLFIVTGLILFTYGVVRNIVSSVEDTKVNMIICVVGIVLISVGGTLSFM